MGGEKPLHVQVAEALGWTDCEVQSFTISGKKYINDKNWIGLPPSGRWFGKPSVFRYDTDWSATGPLIEEYKIALNHVTDGVGADRGWLASSKSDYVDPEDGYLAQAGRPYALGATPLVAVCNLILALKTTGKVLTP